jgi:hypothetical protein
MGSCSSRRWLGDQPLPVDPPCPCGLTGSAFEYHRLDCDRSSHPYIDEQACVLVGEAVASLVVMRGGERGDAGAVLAALASLIAEAQSQVPEAVAEARCQDYTWAEVAGRLASTTSTARRRYGGYAARWRADLPAAED